MTTDNINGLQSPLTENNLSLTNFKSKVAWKSALEKAQKFLEHGVAGKGLLENSYFSASKPEITQTVKQIEDSEFGSVKSEIQTKDSDGNNAPASKQLSEGTGAISQKFSNDNAIIREPLVSTGVSQSVIQDVRTEELKVQQMNKVSTLENRVLNYEKSNSVHVALGNDGLKLAMRIDEKRLHEGMKILQTLREKLLRIGYTVEAVKLNGKVI